MHIYLPIAELSLNALWLVLLGGISGIFSGLFGIGGGFILTPVLLFMGVPAGVAVATSTNMIVASSFSGFLSHHKRKQVDTQIGTWLIAGGALGVAIGIFVFSQLKRLGQIDLIITLLYITLLGAVTLISGREFMKLRAAAKNGETEHKLTPIDLPDWAQKLPFQHYFRRSHVTHSLLIPMTLGLISGLLVALLGVGGGFIMIPAMVYILRMPSSLTVGTTLFQIIFITAGSAFLHAITTHTVDIVLAALLLLGSVIGTQWGVRMATQIPQHYLRGLMALMLGLVTLRLAYGLFITPQEIFTLTIKP